MAEDPPSKERSSSTGPSHSGPPNDDVDRLLSILFWFSVIFMIAGAVFILGMMMKGLL